MLTEMFERFAIGAYTPLEAWLFVVVVMLVPTVVLYLVLQRIQENFASLKGKVGSLVVNLGGPAALYCSLLLLSAHYIDDTVGSARTVSLSGEVRDIAERPMEGNVLVAALPYKARVRADGTFTIRVPYDAAGRYELIAFNDWGFVRLEDFVADNPEQPSEARIRNFPDARYTTFVGGPFSDQADNRISDVEIYVSAQVNPEPLLYGGDDRPATIRVEKGTYSVEFRKRNTNQVIWRRDFTNVAPGSVFQIDPQLNVQAQLTSAE